jgi:hypothetical protein
MLRVSGSPATWIAKSATRHRRDLQHHCGFQGVIILKAMTFHGLMALGLVMQGAAAVVNAENAADVEILSATVRDQNIEGASVRSTITGIEQSLTPRICASAHFYNGRIYEEKEQWGDALREYQAAQSEKGNSVYATAVARAEQHGAHQP